VSWYGSPAGTCASPSLPFGTVVTVTNAYSGASTNCVVNDRGPYVGGRILDLSPASFANIAPLGQGLTQAVLHWQ
jgi:rare lipoprotein A